MEYRVELNGETMLAGSAPNAIGRTLRVEVSMMRVADRHLRSRKTMDWDVGYWLGRHRDLSLAGPDQTISLGVGVGSERYVSRL